MTEKHMTTKKRPSFSVVSLSIFSIFIFVLFLKNSSVASLYVRKGVSICTETLIPSLFPYLVLSDILLALSLHTLIEKPFRKIMHSLFGVSGSGACVFILGIVCGFPLGAKCAVELYDKGEISKSECEKLLAFCNIPSLAFCVGVVGGVFQSSKTGFLLWLCSLISAIIGGMLNKLFYGNKSSKSQESCFSVALGSKKSSGSIFVRAIERSAKSTLLICAYVVFFSALTGTLSFLIKDIAIPNGIKCLIFGVFELTNGISEAVLAASLQSKALLCGFSLGWSGLSVHLQIFSICEGRNLNFKNYLLQKLLQGTICSLLCLFVLTL